MSACPLYPNLGIAQALRPTDANFECTGSQQFGSAPAGTLVNAELAPIRVFLVANIPLFQSNPPSPQDYHNAMAASGKTLIYIEIWENVSTIFGFGWEDVWYIGVWY